MKPLVPPGISLLGLPSSAEPVTPHLELSRWLIAVSPNGDGLHDFLEIENIEQFPENQVIIYDRWGGQVYSAKGYNNTSTVFEGIGNIWQFRRAPEWYLLSI